MKFSQRKGYTKPSEIIQTQGMNENLRVSLWNILDLVVWQSQNFLWSRYSDPEIDKYSKILWFQYFKKTVDTRPDQPLAILQIIRNYFFKCEWFEVYDFLEFTLNYLDDEKINEAINHVLERELSGFKLVAGIFTDITDTQEVEILEEALSDSDFPGVRTHLQRALELLSDRKQPDYRNSIKESISAVESLAQTISAKTKATLDDALKVLEKKNKIHPALQGAFSKLYGYTSNADGIRHALSDETDLGPAEAKYFLLSCTSFINYLKSKV